jgi:hypothetical protein
VTGQCYAPIFGGRCGFLKAVQQITMDSEVAFGAQWPGLVKYDWLCLFLDAGGSVVRVSWALFLFHTSI